MHKSIQIPQSQALDMKCTRNAVALLTYKVGTLRPQPQCAH